MKAQRTIQISLAALLMISFSFAQSAVPNTTRESAPSAVTNPAVHPTGQQAPAPAAAQVPQRELASEGAAPLRVRVGKSLLVNTTQRLKRVSVTDPEVADAVVISTTQVLIHGRAPGEVSLMLWDETERSSTFDLRVDVDTTAAAEDIKRIFPEEQINLEASRNALVLSGHVSTEDMAKRAGLIASAYSKNVVNVLSWGPVGAQEVLLEVRFAEVDRTALTQLGVNLFSTGAGNTFGSIGTQQFGAPAASNIGSVTSDTSSKPIVNSNNSVTGETGRGNFHQPASFGFNDLLNVFLFRADINLGAVIKALQQKNYLQILAEPNLIAMNGKEASFLAGGEFPFPIVQQGAVQSVTIQFKEFGVRLRFTPVIMPNGNIHLQVKPEVSALDFANALTLSGFTIPALSTRRADTEFELQDGQSFVIAGLMDNRVTNVLSKVPGLGDIPVLGALFESKSVQKSKSELMVLVTAHRISPDTKPHDLPAFPIPFVEDNKARSPGGKP